jgi:hypothetical protein
MNVSLLLGSGRLRTPEPLSSPQPLTNHSRQLPEPENEIDVLNRRLDTKQINFIEYLEGISQMMQKENQ